MSTHPNNIGERVRAIRKTRGLSAAKLAEEAHVAPNTISAIENGRSVRPSSLKSVLDALEIDTLENGVGTVTYPSDVELVRDLVGMYLMALPESERPEVAYGLTRYLLNRSQGVDSTERP